VRFCTASALRTLGFFKKLVVKECTRFLTDQSTLACHGSSSEWVSRLSLDRWTGCRSPFQFFFRDPASSAFFSAYIVSRLPILYVFRPLFTLGLLVSNEDDPFPSPPLLETGTSCVYRRTVFRAVRPVTAFFFVLTAMGLYSRCRARSVPRLLSCLKSLRIVVAAILFFSFFF